MPELSGLSKVKLATCTKDLQTFVNKVAEKFLIVVIWGYRNQAQQTDALNRGTTKLPYPRSKHNRTDENGDPESYAVDIAPLVPDPENPGRYHIPHEPGHPEKWLEQPFIELGAACKPIADELYRTEKISHQIDWAPDIFPPDFPDYPHWQIRQN